MSGWFDILARLCRYFQTAGMLSVLAWLAAVAAPVALAAGIRALPLHFVAAVLSGVGLLIACVLAGPAAIAAWVALAAAGALLRPRVGGTRLAAAALALALVGVSLAGANSAAVNRIEVDRRAEHAKALARQTALQAEEVEKIKSSTADIHFVEDTERDRLDLAGKTATQAALLTGDRPVATRPGDDVPEYKRRGKDTRDAARKTGGTEFKGLVEGVEAGEKRAADSPARLLPEWDVVRANRLDRVNLFAARYGLLVALLLVLVDYLSRFNRSFGALLPVPAAGPLAHALFPKSHAVLVESSGPPALREYLETVLRKGETFIYFGPADPWRDGPPAPPPFDLPAGLARLFGRSRPPGSGLYRLPLGLRQVRRLLARPGQPFPDADFIFESAWFARGCFIVETEALCARVLARLVEHLRMRHHAHASARRTVNLLWHFDSPPPADGLRDLFRLAPETNFKLLLWTPAPASPDLAAHFPEHVRLDLPVNASLAGRNRDAVSRRIRDCPPRA